MIMASRKYFDVLVRTPGGLKWKPVDDCLNHAEAREQGKAQYAGDILDTRFNGVKNTNSGGSTFTESSTFGGLALVAVAAGIMLLISLWPIFLIGGIIYGLYKIFKK